MTEQNINVTEDFGGSMKKILTTILIFACAIVVGLFWIRVNQQDTDITKTQTKVGFILNGTVNDHSWGESHYNGMEKSALELNLDVTYTRKMSRRTKAVLPLWRSLLRRAAR